MNAAASSKNIDGFLPEPAAMKVFELQTQAETLERQARTLEADAQAIRYEIASIICLHRADKEQINRERCGWCAYYQERAATLYRSREIRIPECTRLGPTCEGSRISHADYYASMAD